MIPTRIHYVWVGGPMPDKQRRLIETWRATNPEFDILLWNEENIDFSIPLVRRAYEERKWAKVADIVRLSAILEYGGIYLDTDIELFRPLDPLLAHRCFFGFQHKCHPTDWVANGVIGAAPGHWFIRRALDALLAMRPAPFGLERPTTFGPKLITRLLRAEGLRTYSEQGVMVKDIFVCPISFFFPYPFGGEFHPSCITDETYGVHYWERSWDKSLSRPLRLLRSLRALLRQPLRKPV